MLEYVKQHWQEDPDNPRMQAMIRRLNKPDLVRFTAWLCEKGTCPASVDKLVKLLS